MIKPQIGREDTDHRAICGHEPPGGKHCQAAAEMHLLVEHPDGATVTLATCQEHHRIAAAAGPCIDEHEHRGLCGLPGTAWDYDQKQCVIDGSGQEPELRAQVHTTATELVGVDR